MLRFEVLWCTAKLSIRRMSSIKLKDVVDKLEEYAPLRFAESWDNVGLLIEPYTVKPIQKIFLTNDLIESTLIEAVQAKADLIISYHPPIFAPMNRITQESWKERMVAICLEHRIALFSPHTSWDCVKGGICDWLSDSLPFETTAPIKRNAENKEYGLGRLLTLREKINITEAIKKVKVHTGAKNIHLALGKNHTLETSIETVGVCAGSGSSVLKQAIADLFITGEMSHHDVLDCTQRNISVILCNHSHSERGYLQEFKKKFVQCLNNQIEIIISTLDVDPLETY